MIIIAPLRSPVMITHSRLRCVPTNFAPSTFLLRVRTYLRVYISTYLRVYISTYLRRYLLAVYGWWVDTNDDAVRCRVVTLSRWVTGRYCHVSRRQGEILSSV